MWSLSTDLRNIPERHRSMRAVFESAGRLLHDDEMKVLCAASVFQGGFTLVALEYVTEPLGIPLPISSVLNALIDKSLVVVVAREGEGTRFQIHELLRLCAFKHLMETGQSETFQERHLQYFLALVEQAQPLRDAAQKTDGLLVLEAERGNLQAALRWAEDHGDVEARTRLQAVLGLSEA